MIVIGIDEAGRGPVVGNMFVVAVALREEDIGKLESLGIRDSKKLTPNKRALLRGVVERVALAYSIVEVSVESINEGNLNELTIKAMKEALANVLREIGKVDLVIADVVGNGKRQLEELRELADRVVVEKGADSKYPAVSAASILAKEKREEHVRALRALYGDFGSGYPSDPKTRKWLALNLEAPIVRRKWKTVQRVASKQSSKPSKGHLL
ncbi:ribonuclease HII [Ignicoccus islandicus]|uniref:ribonuclease HII n=1 Tax=Ignicoccus islandicus TaxID=54259 RepID=UPI0009467B18|nr:ribonuclease HII [Ignicoccus islandicus]